MHMFIDNDLDKTKYLVVQYWEDTDKYCIVLRTTDEKVARDKVRRLWEQGKKAQLKREVIQDIE